MANEQLRHAMASRRVASTYGPSLLSSFMERFGMLAVLIVLFGLAGLVSRDFLTPRNLLNVSRQVSLNGVISVGMTMVILTHGIDLSVGSVVALSAVLLAKYNNLGPVVLLLALGAGITVGLLNGFFITRFRMQPFVVTLGMMIAVRGVALIVARSHPIEHVPKVARFIGHGEIGPIPTAALLLAVIAVLAWIFLSKVRVGRHLYAVGGNEDSAHLAGINVNAVKLLVYVLGGALAAVAGIIISGHLNVGDPAYGSGFELDAIAAVAIGGTSLAGGRGGVGSTIVGLLIVGMVSNLLNLLNVAGYTQFIISGSMIVLAVAIQRLRAD